MDDLIKDRIATLQADRETAHAALDRARGTSRGPIVISSEKVAAFGQLMRERLTSGGVQFRKAYLGAIIDRVEVNAHKIRFKAEKTL